MRHDQPVEGEALVGQEEAFNRSDNAHKKIAQLARQAAASPDKHLKCLAQIEKLYVESVKSVNPTRSRENL